MCQDTKSQVMIVPTNPSVGKSNPLDLNNKQRANRTKL